jgi:CNT family concentrative nucleoside transporter
MDRFVGLLGLIAIVGGCYFFSSARHKIKPRLLYWGLGMQFGFALLVLKTPFGKIFQAASSAVNALLHYSEEGAAFMFGNELGKGSGQFGVIFAFQVLPIVIFIASVFSVLYYFGIMQIVIRAMAQVMRRTIGREHLYGTDRSTAYDQTISCRAYRKRAIHDHDERYGSRLRGGDGGIR